MSILTNFQERLIKELSQTRLKDKFFLTGGTALSAFYLEHRYSEDLDFFTENDKTCYLGCIAKFL